MLQIWKWRFIATEDKKRGEEEVEAYYKKKVIKIVIKGKRENCSVDHTGSD